MERKNFAVLCAAVLCFWLFALALGTAEGVGLRAVMHPEERAVSADVEEAAEGILLPAAAAAPQLDLNCRAAILVEQGSGRVLYEKNADERVPIASITKVEGALLVRVQFSDRQDLNQNVALIDQSTLTDGMRIVFLKDDDASILYVQSYSAPAEVG